MKSIFTLVFILLIAITSQVQEKLVPLGDPFIMLHKGKYYAYGTNAADGIQVYTSKDLMEWSLEPHLALKSADSWGGKWFWAPEVYYIKEKKKFFMYYSANEHICVASADSPLGPFIQEKKAPMLPNEKAIDNSLFIDSDGKPYLYFDRFNDGLNIWVAKLQDDLITIDTTSMKPCIHVSQDWETVWPRVNEGSFVIQNKGLYYMTYSANSYESQHYGIGFATAKYAEGPWTKYDKNPIFQMPEDLVGVGHSAMFRDKEGKLRIVFHSHHSKEKIHPRGMYIATVDFSKDKVPVMQIKGKILRPKLK